MHDPRRHLRRRSRPFQLRLRRQVPERLDLPRHARRRRRDARRRPALEGTAQVESISIRTPEQFRAHVLSEDFFDAANHPTVTFVSSDLDLREDGTAEANGELTIQGITNPVTATGTWTPPAADAFGNTRAHLQLEAVIDRTQWDMNWNMPLPAGGNALANDVTLTVDIALKQD